MAIPTSGSVNASLYQLTTNNSLNTGGLVDAALTTLGFGGAFVADPLATSAPITFGTSTTNGVTTNTITYGNTTLSGVALTQEGTTGFTFTAADGHVYYLTNNAIGATATVDANPLLGGLGGALLDPLVGPNPIIYVGSTNTPADLTAGAYVACFARGTLIATSDGERPVEDLRIGDMVVTQSGIAKPVLWIGRRCYARAFFGANKKIVPVRIAQGALAEGLPKRDLYVSPCHALLIDGMLIPAGELVNGLTITQASREETIEYFHIEMEDHDVVLAEGVLAETFIDHESRAMFENIAEYEALYPDREDVEPIYSAPRVEDGEALQAVRERLAIRAGIRPALDHAA